MLCQTLPHISTPEFYLKISHEKPRKCKQNNPFGHEMC